MLEGSNGSEEILAKDVDLQGGVVDGAAQNQLLAAGTIVIEQVAKESGVLLAGSVVKGLRGIGEAPAKLPIRQEKVATRRPLDR